MRSEPLYPATCGPTASLTATPTATPSQTSSPTLTATGSPSRTPTRTPTAALSANATASNTASASRTPSDSSSNRASPTGTPTPSTTPPPLGASPSGSPSLSPSGTALPAPVVVARVGLALPHPVRPALLDAVLLLLLRWLALPPSTPATYAGAPTGSGDGVVYTFSFIVSQAGRLLQGGAAGIDALLDGKLNDGSLVAEVAASGLAPALGYDSAESLVNAVAALPAVVVQPSVSPSPSPAAPPAHAALSTGETAGLAVGAALALLLLTAAVAGVSWCRHVAAAPKAIVSSAPPATSPALSRAV